MIKESRKILFEGDNYSSAWEKEAEKRGLPNLKTTPDALKIYSSKKQSNYFLSLESFLHENSNHDITFISKTTSSKLRLKQEFHEIWL